MKNRNYLFLKVVLGVCISILQISMLKSSFYLSPIDLEHKVEIEEEFEDSVINGQNREEISDAIDNEQNIEDNITNDSLYDKDETIEPACVHEKQLEYPNIPKDVPSFFISHKGYALSFNLTTHCPNWVAWKLTKDMTNGRWARSNDYRSDRLVPFDHRVDEKSFSGSGYDRGHMCPAGDMSWDSEAMSATFYMSNMCPQAPVLNQKWWERLESACRRWANQEGEIYICCGPIYKDFEHTISSYPTVTVPSAFFKVIISLCPDREKGIGFFYLNNDSRQTMTDAVRTIDEIEELTGYDFFPILDDDLENKIESMSNLNKWN